MNIFPFGYILRKEKIMKDYHTSSHAVFLLQYHLVLVTKYRKKVLAGEVAEDLKSICQRLITENFEGRIVEMETDKDHIHILFDIGPKYSVTEVVNSLKGVSSRLLRRDHKEELQKLLYGSSLWSESYFVSTTGGVTIEILKKYVESQPTKKRGRGRPWPKKSHSSTT